MYRFPIVGPGLVVLFTTVVDLTAGNLENNYFSRKITHKDETGLLQIEALSSSAVAKLSAVGRGGIGAIKIFFNF